MLDVLTVRGAPTFSVVIPVFDEAEVLPEFHRRLSAVMNLLGTWEAIYVNDGSCDTSLRLWKPSTGPSRAWRSLICRAISARRSPPPPAWSMPAARR